MDVACEMQVHLFHRHDLAATAARAAALDTKDGAEGRLAKRDDCTLTDAVEALCQADGGCGLALAEGRGSYSGDDNVLGIRLVLEPLDGLKLYFGLGGAV